MAKWSAAQEEQKKQAAEKRAGLMRLVNGVHANG